MQIKTTEIISYIKMNLMAFPYTNETENGENKKRKKILKHYFKNKTNTSLKESHINFLRY